MPNPNPNPNPNLYLTVTLKSLYNAQIADLFNGIKHFDPHKPLRPHMYSMLTGIELRYVLQLTQRENILTVEGQIAKCGSEEVHGEHAQYGNIANILHPSLGWALGKQHDRHFKQGKALAYHERYTPVIEI